FIAGLARSEYGVVTGMLCPAAHHHLARAITELVIGLELVRDRLAQLRETRARRVFRESRFERGDRRLLDVLRRIEIRFARAEAADIDAFGFHRFRFAVDRESEGGR